MFLSPLVPTSHYRPVSPRHQSGDQQGALTVNKQGSRSPIGCYHPDNRPLLAALLTFSSPQAHQGPFSFFCLYLPTLRRKDYSYCQARDIEQELEEEITKREQGSVLGRDENKKTKPEKTADRKRKGPGLLSRWQSVFCPL